MDSETKLFQRVLGYAQNLGTNEDILTAFLAGMFKESRTFTGAFLADPRIFGNLQGVAGRSLDRQKLEGWLGRYDLDSGIRISPREFDWAGSVDFKPDIWLWDSEYTKVEDSLNIFIEAKLNTPLSDSQKVGYPKMRKKLGESWTYTLLICAATNVGSGESKEFCSAVSWSDALDVIEKSFTVEMDRAEKKNIGILLALMRSRLSPLNEVRPSETPKELLKRLANETKWYFGKNKFEGRQDYAEGKKAKFSGDYDYVQWQPVALTEKGYVSIAFFTKNTSIGIQVQLWDKETGEDSFKNVGNPIGLGQGASDWFEAMSKLRVLLSPLVSHFDSKSSSG